MGFFFLLLLFLLALAAEKNNKLRSQYFRDVPLPTVSFPMPGLKRPLKIHLSAFFAIV